MMIPRLALGALLAAALAVPAHAEKLSLRAISKYLNGLQTATGAFTQINSDGSISTGTIYIKRPGRVRFEYDPPETALVLAGGGQVAIFDPKSNQPPDRYPLNQTPLSIILARDVNLGRADMVTGHTSDGTTTTVIAQDPDNPEYGSLSLVFSGPPVELRQWVITDDAGGQTTVILGELTKGGTIRDVLFNIRAEMRAQGFPN